MHLHKGQHYTILLLDFTNLFSLKIVSILKTQAKLNFQKISLILINAYIGILTS